jgi:putative ATPase
LCSSSFLRQFSGLIAYEAAAEDARQTQAEPVPLHLRNAPTKLMKGLGYGKDYQYAHDYEAGKAEMDCLPEKLKGKKYYGPA